MDRQWDNILVANVALYYVCMAKIKKKTSEIPAQHSCERFTLRPPLCPIKHFSPPDNVHCCQTNAFATTDRLELWCIILLHRTSDRAFLQTAIFSFSIAFVRNFASAPRALKRWNVVWTDSWQMNWWTGWRASDDVWHNLLLTRWALRKPRTRPLTLSACCAVLDRISRRLLVSDRSQLNNGRVGGTDVVGGRLSCPYTHTHARTSRLNEWDDGRPTTSRHTPSNYSFALCVVTFNAVSAAKIVRVNHFENT